MDIKTFQDIKLADYRPPEFVVEQLDLNVALYDDQTVVTARSRFARNPNSTGPQGELILWGEHLELTGIALDGQELTKDRYRCTEHALVVKDVPDRFTLEIVTLLHPEQNTALSGLYRSSGMFCTQCEAEGFRRITYYPDRPDVLTRFITRIEAPLVDCPVLLANGNLVDSGVLSETRHYAVWEDPFPKPSYLFALVAGQLERIEDSFVTQSGKTVRLEIYVQEKNRDRCHHAMASLKKAMRWDEQEYGREYDLERYMIVAVDDFNMGAMENKGLNIFNAKYVLASPETATDQDYLGIEGVIAHEYFHNWTGNRVTCRDWFQLSLKEGLTVFRDQQFSAAMQSAAAQRIEDVRLLRQFQFREDSGPMAHPVRPDHYLEINNFYTVTVYNKGAEVIRMLHTMLGPILFRQGMDLYFDRHDGQAVTCDDFVAAMADASGKDLEQFKRWYSQAGTPHLRVVTRWHQETGEYELIITQTTPPTPGQADKLPLHMPVVVGLLAADGDDLAPAVSCPYDRQRNNFVLELKQDEQRFVFNGVHEQPVLSFLRGFSAPVHVERFHTREELGFIMKNDSDLFNRWDAAGVLSESIILECADMFAANGTFPILQEVYTAAVRHNLQNPPEDRSLAALALQLPAESQVLQRMTIVDPDGLHHGRQYVRKSLAEQLSNDFMIMYKSCKPAEEYRPTGNQIGIRSLRNICLDYLTAIVDQRKDLLHLCRDHYFQANCMTDQYGALTALVHHQRAERDELFAHFEQRWKHDPLTMDKWFALQAGSSAPDTYSKVLELLEHSAFSMKNPNKVRALIGGFGQNHFHFHHNSGRGYRFLAAMIVELDALNPQIAARLVNPLVSWQRYDENRQHMMRAALEEIACRHGLSRDVHEIVRKSLDVQLAS